MSPITFRRPGPTPPSLLYDELQAAAIHEAAGRSAGSSMLGR
jgi:hypothetical protein